jgi:hypothetical protein
MGIGVVLNIFRKSRVKVSAARPEIAAPEVAVSLPRPAREEVLPRSNRWQSLLNAVWPGRKEV